MATTKYVNVKTYKRPLKRRYTSCLHCGSSAKVTADRINNGFKMFVRFCEEHAQEVGAIK